MRTLLILLALALPVHGQVKIKDGRVIDKSKPVRRALEAWYQRNVRAFAAKDVAAIMALRTPDFHTVTLDGATHTRAEMETRTTAFLRAVDHFIAQQNDIGTIELGAGCAPDGDQPNALDHSVACNASTQWASADVHQHLVRMARIPDGTLHKIETSVTQRETFRLTPSGWQLYRVDNIRDSRVLVDDQPRKSGESPK